MSNIKIDPQIAETWEKLSKGKTDANWMAVEFKKANKDTTLELMAQGDGGLEEISQKLKQIPEKVIFGLVKVKFYDEIAAQKGSPYVKFIYFRFLGSKVGVMTKGFLTPRLGSIDEIFPVKHLSYDIDENLTKFDQKSIASDFLRVSDNKVEASTFDFGPNQVYQSQNQKVVNNNKQPKNDYVPNKNKQPAKPKAEPKPEPKPEPEPEYSPPNNDNDAKVDDDAPANQDSYNEPKQEEQQQDDEQEQQQQEEEEQQQQQDEQIDENSNYNQDNTDD